MTPISFVSVKLSHYLNAYQQEFVRVPDVRRVLEIGVAGGGSLQMWRRLYPQAEVIGLDIDPRCRNARGPGIDVLIGDQSDTHFLEKMGRTRGPFDLIVDDGCHRTLWQIASFHALWPFLSDPGCYCVEDLHTAYAPWWRFGNWAGSFQRYAGTHLVDAANAFWRKSPGRYAGQIERISFRDSLVFIHKGRHPLPQETCTGGVDCRTGEVCKGYLTL